MPQINYIDVLTTATVWLYESITLINCNYPIGLINELTILKFFNKSDDCVMNRSDSQKQLDYSEVRTL
jgi:hypothetical protein